MELDFEDQALVWGAKDGLAPSITIKVTIKELVTIKDNCFANNGHYSCHHIDHFCQVSEGQWKQCALVSHKLLL